MRISTGKIAAISMIGLAFVTLGARVPGQTSAATAPAPLKAIAPYIDAHVHLDDHSAAGVASMLETMSRQNVKKVFMLVPPYTYDDPANYDSEILLAISKQHPDKLAVIGGGGSLNAMLQQSVVSGDAGPAVRAKFKARAEELVRLGVIGFGEMTTEHFPSPGSATYQYAPADHPLLLLLADISAQHGLPIVLHTEAVPQDMPLPSPLKSPPNPPTLHSNIEALGRLLAHNRHAKIIWAHAGSDNTGFRTPDICRRMLAAHPNLYMEIKVDPTSPGKNPPVADGRIKPDWLQLYRDFPDRFMIGSDQHYPEATGPQRWQAAIQLLDQLPADLRTRIGTQNPLRIYDGKPN
jgi:predicted TIM-barrel fold metal-dependent hydrolase